jgi:hypothetical protein
MSEKKRYKPVRNEFCHAQKILIYNIELWMSYQQSGPLAQVCGQKLRCNIQKLTKFASWLDRGANNLLMPYKRQGREFDPRRDQFSFLMFFELGCVKPGQA